jgi:hypothetical protein
MTIEVASVGFGLLALGLSAAQRPIGAIVNATGNIAFPDVPGVVDITQPPYNAKGDGLTDDTQALQKALADLMGQHKILYLPSGTYLVNKTLRWSKKDSRAGDAWGFVTIQGQNQAKTIIRLKDGTFPNGAQPIMWCGGFGSADWFHNYIQNLTFSVGKDNPGAVGLNFYSNNSGAIRDVRIISEDGKGAVGLELGNDMNGPLLVRNVTVKGFAVGIRTASSVNSQTFEHISLFGQSRYGFNIEGQSIAIRGLYSENAVTALRVGSFATLLDAKLVGKDAASGVPAIQVTRTAFFARNLTTSGYQCAISANGGQGADGPVVAEFSTGKPTRPFGGPGKSLNLPVEETPEVPWDDPKTWAVVAVNSNFDGDSADAAQKAIDSGATTVFFPTHASFYKPVIVRGKVRRILGTGAWIDYNSHCKPDFIVADGEVPVVVIENMAPINGGVEINTNRTVVLKSVETGRLACKNKGKLFLEDFCGGNLRFIPGQQVWARQLNVENEGTHVLNDGASLWIHGYKTERGGVLIHTKNGGKTEVFGTFSYTTTAPALGPMFLTEDASVFAFFNEVTFGQPFVTLIKETRGGETKTIPRGQGSTTPYIAVPAGK